jgi:hypothetical protein
MSARATKPALYCVADTSLRCYLANGTAAHRLSRRGRGTAAETLINRRWSSWRGRAAEPVIQDALSIAAAELPWPEAIAIGGWRNRAFDPEIDLIGAGRAPVARKCPRTEWAQSPYVLIAMFSLVCAC